MITEDRPIATLAVEDRPAPGRATLLVFADDWGRHPSSCQHLVGRLLGRHDVLWVNTIGMRPPSFSLSTFKRATQKFGQWLLPRRGESASPSGPVPTVLDPKMWPWIRRRFDRRLNRALLLRQLQPVLERIDGPVVAVTTLPVVADLVGELPVDRWVYYCVDDFGQWPGLDGTTLTRMEESLAARADVVVAAGRVLEDRMRRFRDDVSLLEHGVDLDHWRGRPATDLEWPFNPPVATFWGLVDQRMDITFLEQLDADFGGSIVLVGPEDNPPKRVRELDRVHCFGAVDYDVLPAVAMRSDVLVMPYVDAPVTRAMQPLKLLEYLATGKPVVARDLPANRAWSKGLDLTDDPAGFARLAVQRATEGLPADQCEARTKLESHGWEAKSRRFERLLMEGSAQSWVEEPRT